MGFRTPAPVATLAPFSAPYPMPANDPPTFLPVPCPPRVPGDDPARRLIARTLDDWPGDRPTVRTPAGNAQTLKSSGTRC